MYDGYYHNKASINLDSVDYVRRCSVIKITHKS